MRVWRDTELGEQRIIARAIGRESNVQPAANDPFMTIKITYWESNGQIAPRVEISA